MLWSRGVDAGWFLIAAINSLSSVSNDGDGWAMLFASCRVVALAYICVAISRNSAELRDDFVCGISTVVGSGEAARPAVDGPVALLALEGV